MTSADVRFGESDLTTCDREPIHTPGSIQPYGVMLVLDRQSRVVEQIAGDTRFLLGIDPARLFGVAISAILDPESQTYLDSMLEPSTDFIAPNIHLGVRTKSGSLLLDLTVHAIGGTVIVELEPARRTGSLTGNPFSHLKTLLTRVRGASGLDELCNMAVTDLKRLSGYGRVMVYRFLEDGTGVVIAESLSAGVQSYLGLHYPASDIPQQARELYRRSWLRGTPDIDCTPAPLTPAANPRTGLPIDMSYCALRTMSPIHGEYLRNMGVCASLSISIVLEDRLWGLCVLHDFVPHHVPADLRVALESFAQVFSLMVETKVHSEDSLGRKRARGIRDRLAARLVGGAEMAPALASAELLDYVGATGAALIFEGKVTTIGQTPPAADIDALATWLGVNGESVVATDCLSHRYAPASRYAEPASGLLAITLSKYHRDFVLWFRPEIVRTVRWGGDPAKPVMVGPLGARLTPRGSFAEWRQESRNKSQVWAAVDVESAQELRVALLEALLRAGDAQIRTVFEAMSEGFVLQGRDGAILKVNPAAETILGLTSDQLVGRSSMDPRWQSIREDASHFPAEEHPAMTSLRTGKPVRRQIMGVNDPRSGLRWLSINAEPIFDVDPRVPSAVVTTFVDVTEQRKLSEELRVVQADLKAILDNMPARITSWHRDYTNRFANLKAAQDFGVAAATAVGMHVRDVIGDERFARAKPYIDAAFGGATQSHEQIDRAPDGTPRYSHVSYIPKRRDDAIVGLYALAIDVTELHNTYERIRELAQRLENVRESERRSIAQALHEGIAQDLFAIKLGLDHLQAQVSGHAEVTDAFKELSGAIATCMSDTRHIANDLQPTALAHLRVAVAIMEHAQFFAKHTKLKIRVDELAPFPEVDGTLRLFLFRAAQELLTNVARHANASTVALTLRTDHMHVVLDVVDDGLGIAHGALEKPGSLGLLGLRERAQALGGGLTATRNRGAGTTISISVPLQN